MEQLNHARPLMQAESRSFISGSTCLAGVIGWPVSHSRSPRMHNAAFAALGLDWTYLPLPVAPPHLADAIAGLRALGFAGANVTVPHKQAVMRRMDLLTPIARAIGAVNTIIVNEDGDLLGDSTDGCGFLRDLADHDIRKVERALVIGSGGAARSVVYALAEAGSAVTVCARDVGKAGALCEVIAQALPSAAGRLSIAAFPAALAHVASDAALLINATSLGMRENDPAPWDPNVRFRPGQAAYDLIYNRGTEFLRLAASQGAQAIDGLGMLVHQGARSFELWTGVAAPLAVMMAAAKDG